MIVTTPAHSKLRHLRDNPLVWGFLFLVLAGPLNPAAWLAWLVVDGKLSGNDFALLAWTVLMPSTLIALLVLGTMWRRRLFSDFDLWVTAVIGLGFGILAGPLGFILGSPHGLPQSGEVIYLYPLMLIFGTVIGIIPYFAIVFGLPCMFATIAIGYLCSQPIQDPPKTHGNTKLPKPPKPL